MKRCMIFAAAFLLLLSCGCSRRKDWTADAVGSPAGEEQAGTAAAEADGLAGSYYNDFLRETLTLDGLGGCMFSSEEQRTAGSYTRDGTGLRVQLPDETLQAEPDGDGNLKLAGRRGSYLGNWDFWGISPQEAGLHAAAAMEDAEELPLGGGRYRFRDLRCGVALTYTPPLEVLERQLIHAVAVTDGSGGYVSGRNVTESFLARSGSETEFLEDYIRTFVFADFDSFFGGVSAYEDLTLLEQSVDGRLAAATLRLRSDAKEIDTRVLLYTSVYADGTENYICKTVFAPVGSTEQMEALLTGVTDLGAVRKSEA